MFIFFTAWFYFTISSSKRLVIQKQATCSACKQQKQLLLFFQTLLKWHSRVNTNALFITIKLKKTVEQREKNRPSQWIIQLDSGWQSGSSLYLEKNKTKLFFHCWYLFTAAVNFNIFSYLVDTLGTIESWHSLSMSKTGLASQITYENKPQF